MHHLALAFTLYVHQVHAHHGYATDWRVLAGMLGVLIRPGPFNSFLPGDLPIITLVADSYAGRWSYKPMHELGHVLLKRSGIESEIIREAGGVEEALPIIEALCHHAAGLLQMPAPLLNDATQKYGQGAGAVLHLQQNSAASLRSAMRRWVYDQPDEARAAFTTSGSYISDAAAWNMCLPFWTLDRVAEVTLAHPEVKAISVGRRRLLGVVAW